jgi:amino acid transporter
MPYDSADEGLFVRKSSGLVREMGLRQALAVNIAGVNPTGIGFFFFIILEGFPGTDLTVPMLVAVVGAIVLSAVYSQLVAVMPRSGADSIYASRTLHPAIGAAVGLGIFWATLISFGGNAAVFGEQYFPFVSQTFGAVFHSNALTTFAVTLSGKTGSLITALVLMLVIGGLMTRSVATIGRFIFWTFVIATLGALVLIFEFLFHSHTSFVHAFNHAVGNPGAYAQLVAAAHHAGVTTGTHWSAVWSSVALTSVLFVGVTWANFSGGELRRPGRNYRIATFAGLAAMFSLFFLSWITVRHMTGLGFLQSSAGLSAANPAAYAKAAGSVTAYLPSYGLLVAGDPVTKILIAVGYAAGIVGLGAVFALILSRLLFALSFDRLLPTKVADVDKRMHAPLWAIGITMLLGVLAAILTIETSLLSVSRNAALITFATFAIAGLTAAVLPYRRRDLYNQAPRMIGPDIAGVPMVTFVGIATALYWGFLTYLAAAKTQVNGGYSTSSVITLAVMCFSGAVCYVVSRVWLGRKGLNLNLALHELPPE